VIITNSSTNIVIASNALMADDPWSRMKGLLGKTGLSDGEGLVITQCNSIHMFFMQFAIDVIFVDRSLNVVGLVRNIPPFSLSPIFWKAVSCIELPSGVIDRQGIRPGHQLALVNQQK